MTTRQVHGQNEHNTKLNSTGKLSCVVSVDSVYTKLRVVQDIMYTC